MLQHFQNKSKVAIFCTLGDANICSQVKGKVAESSGRKYTKRLMKALGPLLYYYADSGRYLRFNR